MASNKMSTPIAQQNSLQVAVKNHVKKLGRPTDYSEELAARILHCIADGQSLREICREDWAPHWSTIYAWIEEKPFFSDAFARARVMQSHMFADRALAAPEEALESIQGDKSDSARVNAHRIKYEAYKWRAGVQNAEYRDKVQGGSGSVGVSISITGLEKEPIEAEIVTDVT